MSSINHRPAFLDRVWVEKRMKQGKQPNGYIKRVFWHDREVLVKFLDTKEDPESMTFDDLWGNWNSRYRIYFIHDEDAEHEEPGVVESDGHGSDQGV